VRSEPPGPLEGLAADSVSAAFATLTLRGEAGDAR
jgi:hypothetical protein